MRFFLLALSAAFFAPAFAHADTQQDLDQAQEQKLAQPPPQPQPKRYKTVVKEWDEPDYFNGKPPEQVNNFSVGFGLDYFDSAGLQARYARRVINKGPINSINNSLYIEGGMGFTLYGKTTGVNFQVGPRWDFQMDPKWIFFAELALGFNAVNSTFSSTVHGANFYLSPGVGAMYNFSTEWAARVDFSTGFLGVGMLYRF